jgi:hypothetical protein
MDELDCLANAYRARASASVKSKLDVLMKLEGVRDARVVPFLLTVLKDRRENGQVRIYVDKHLRNGGGPHSNCSIPMSGVKRTRPLSGG